MYYYCCCYRMLRKKLFSLPRSSNWQHYSFDDMAYAFMTFIYLKMRLLIHHAYSCSPPPELILTLSTLLTLIWWFCTPPEIQIWDHHHIPIHWRNKYSIPANNTYLTHNQFNPQFIHLFTFLHSFSIHSTCKSSSRHLLAKPSPWKYSPPTQLTT